MWPAASPTAAYAASAWYPSMDRTTAHGGHRDRTTTGSSAGPATSASTHRTVARCVHIRRESAVRVEQTLTWTVDAGTGQRRRTPPAPSTDPGGGTWWRGHRPRRNSHGHRAGDR